MDNDKDLVALTAIALMAITPLLITALVLHFRIRSRQSTNDLINRLVEKDRPIPAELLAGHADQLADLRWGAVLIALGLGLLLAGYFLSARWITAGAFIPIFMGGGFLVTFAVQRATGSSSH
jgi:uncharacterized protein DUF6249